MNETNKSAFSCGRVGVPLYRREWLRRAGRGAGMIAMASILAEQKLLGASQDRKSLTPLLSKFPAKAKSVIWLFMEGAPSSVDMFDPKPELIKRDGQRLTEKYSLGILDL